MIESVTAELPSACAYILPSGMHIDKEQWTADFFHKMEVQYLNQKQSWAQNQSMDVPFDLYQLYSLVNNLLSQLP